MMKTIIDNLGKIDRLTYETEHLLAEYIKEKFNGIIVFDDSTGYPSYYDDSDSMTQEVVAVRIGEDDDILFNTNLRQNENGEWNEVDEDEWFRPRDYGTFDLANLVDAVCSAGLVR